MKLEKKRQQEYGACAAYINFGKNDELVAFLIRLSTHLPH